MKISIRGYKKVLLEVKNLRLQKYIVDIIKMTSIEKFFYVKLIIVYFGKVIYN